jgi:hypothetical protein
LRFGAVSRSANVESKERNGKPKGEKVVRSAHKGKPEHSHGFSRSQNGRLEVTNALDSWFQHGICMRQSDAKEWRANGFQSAMTNMLRNKDSKLFRGSIRYQKRECKWL